MFIMDLCLLAITIHLIYMVTLIISVYDQIYIINSIKSMSVNLFRFIFIMYLEGSNPLRWILFKFLLSLSLYIYIWKPQYFI